MAACATSRQAVKRTVSRSGSSFMMERHCKARNADVCNKPPLMLKPRTVCEGLSGNSGAGFVYRYVNLDSLPLM